MIHAFIKKGCFQDSVSLMIISRKLSESENVDDVSVMMGTPANKALLDTTGFWHDDFNNATPNDICVAIRSEAADAGIAQAIMEKPKLLILDEPFNGLDKEGVEQMRTYFLELKKQGVTILLSSHTSEDIKLLCDTVTEMEKGKTVILNDRRNYQ